MREARIRGGTAGIAAAYDCLISKDKVMAKFLLFCILLVLCWPLALLALIAYPFVWLLLIPFRLVGIAVGGVLELVSAIIFLPVRLVRAI
jgi:hypothetical protein